MSNLEKKYLTIGELSQRTHVPQYTLRYWEKEFKLLKPERYSGLRKYSYTDVDLVLTIKDLLYEKRLTIEGVKKYLQGDKRKKIKDDNSFKEQNIAAKELEYIKNELNSVLEILKE